MGRTGTGKRTRVARQHYTEEEINRGLAALAQCSGNTRRASQRLKDAGYQSIPQTTLHNWKTQHADRYAHICQDEWPKVHARLAEQMEELAQEEIELERETARKFRDELPNLKASEAAGALRNLGVAKGINLDKAAPIRGRPSQITEHRDAAELIRKIEHVSGGAIKIDLEAQVIEGTAQEED